jgi:transcriptional regulator with XRE-family HTH domain
MTTIKSSSLPGSTPSSGIGARISQVRHHLTQTKFADSLGIHKNTLIRYEKEKRLPDAALLIRICEQYGVDPTWLLTGESGSTPGSKEMLPALNDYITLPFCSSLENTVGEQKPLAIKKSWIHCQLQAQPEDLRLFYVEGESMKPTLYPDDVILLNLHETIVKEGIYALQIGEVLVIKRLQRLSENVIEVISDNPMYESWTANLKDPTEKLKIVGRVVCACRKI